MDKCFYENIRLLSYNNIIFLAIRLGLQSIKILDNFYKRAIDLALVNKSFTKLHNILNNVNYGNIMSHYQGYHFLYKDRLHSQAILEDFNTCVSSVTKTQARRK